MIPSLFAYRMRLRKWAIAAWSSAGFALGVAATFLFLPGPREVLALWRDGLGQVFMALGMMGADTLAVHLLETVYGFLFPLCMILHTGSSGMDAYARPVTDGRMAALLGAPHSHAGIFSTLAVSQAAESAALCLACLAGQAAGGFAFHGQLDFIALARVMAGFLPVCLVYAAFSTLCSLLPRTARGAWRVYLLVSLATLGLQLAARFPAAFRARLLTPLTLHRGLALVSGMGGWIEAACALTLALAMYAVALFVFSRREL